MWEGDAAGSASVCLQPLKQNLAHALVQTAQLVSVVMEQFVVPSQIRLLPTVSCQRLADGFVAPQRRFQRLRFDQDSENKNPLSNPDRDLLVAFGESDFGQNSTRISSV
jgi:hypothetical protein